MAREPKDDGHKPTTTDAGVPVASDEFSLTVGADGPILLQDHYLIEQMANFNRERIPERQPHAKGGGAFGRFEVSKDVSNYTKAADARVVSVQPTFAQGLVYAPARDWATMVIDECAAFPKFRSGSTTPITSSRSTATRSWRRPCGSSVSRCRTDSTTRTARSSSACSGSRTTTSPATSSLENQTTATS
jgi:hypothetical protein